MSEIMLLGILRMPLPDSPADMGVMEWMQVKDRMRQAADELEEARAALAVAEPVIREQCAKKCELLGR